MKSAEHAMRASGKTQDPSDAGTWLVQDTVALARLREDVAMYGFGCLENAVSETALAELCAEAAPMAEKAQIAEQATGLSYRARIGSFGPATATLLSSQEAHALLRAVFDGEFSLSEEVSCITFYAPGDHLGPHLDKPPERCAVTILVYLQADSQAQDVPDTGLVLRIYGETMEAGAPARAQILTRAASIVLGYGSRIWHERPPLRKGEKVIAITGCYAPAVERSSAA